LSFVVLALSLTVDRLQNVLNVSGVGRRSMRSCTHTRNLHDSGCWIKDGVLAD